MGILCYSLKQVPDLSLCKYQSLADTGVEGVLKRHENFLRHWHGICIESSTSMHLLYVYMPSELLGKRLKIFFLLQGDDVALQLVNPLVQKSPLSDFFTLVKDTLPAISMLSGATLTKKERVADIFNPMTGKCHSIHYVPKWEVNENARQYDLLRIMETVGQAYVPEEPCAFRIDMYPVSMSMDTRKAFDPILKSLRGQNDLKLLKESESVKSDEYAKDVCREYEEWLTSIETSPHFRVNIYSFANTIFQAKVLLNAAGSEALNEGDFSTAQIRADANGAFNLLSRMDRIANDYSFFPQQAVLQSWPTTYCLSEVIPFFRFPALYDGETIDLPKETSPVYVNEGIYLGKDANGYPVNFPLKDLTRHAFFTGMPGSGKTNTMLHLISQLKKHVVPFLVLEPAKKEYRALLGTTGMHDVCLFSPHLQSKFPLQINPLEFPVGVRLSEHINALLEVFQGSFVLEGPTYKFLSSSIQKSYTDLGWDIEDINTTDCELPYPTLQNVYDNLEHEVDSSSYDTELKGNVRAFLQVRLGGLMERDAGELFNVPFSTLKPKEWVEKSAIVELEVLGEQAKNFFVLLVCNYILETLKSDPSGGMSKDGTPLPVRHVLFIEEAHNIIAPSTHQSSSDSVDPKISATACIVKMLAEVRALREAIVIADQLPTALACEVTKNTGLKIIHRLTSQDDREQIGSAISASPLQLERMAAFTSGQAYVYHEKTARPFEIQIAEWISSAIAFDYTNDSELFETISSQPPLINSITIALESWKEKYLFPIDDQIFEFQQLYLTALIDRNASTLVICSAKKELLLFECNRLAKKVGQLKKLWSISNHPDTTLFDIFLEIEQYIESMNDRILAVKLT